MLDKFRLAPYTYLMGDFRWLLACAAFCVSLSWAGTEPVAVPAGGNQLSREEFERGMANLKLWLEKRGEDAETAGVFIGEIQSLVEDQGDNRMVPVTRSAFEAFLKYERAWEKARKDAQGAGIPAAQLKDEVRNLDQIKKSFDARARKESPAFYAAFKKAGADIRQYRANRGLGTGGGGGGLFFSRPDDAANSSVDSGADALQSGDDEGAISQADAAIAQDPDNADAYALRAAAHLDTQNYAAAAQDAQTALSLDPQNPQAQGILAMSAAPIAISGIAKDAAATASALTGSSPAPAAAESGRSYRALAGTNLGAASMGQAFAPPSPAPRPLSPPDPIIQGRSDGADRGRRGILGIDAPVEQGGGEADVDFNQARLWAEEGHRDAALDFVGRAARADPSYRAVADAAAALPANDDRALAQLFSDEMIRRSNLREKAGYGTDLSWGLRRSKALLGLGIIGAVLLVSGLLVMVPRRKRRRR